MATETEARPILVAWMSWPFDGVEVTHNMPTSWRGLFVEPESRP